MREALTGCDAVVHSAALVATDPRQTPEMLSTNMQGAGNVLGQAVQLGLDPIIHVSSFTALFHPGLKTLTADLPVVGGTDGYGTSKAQVEIYARGLQDAGRRSTSPTRAWCWGRLLATTWRGRRGCQGGPADARDPRSGRGLVGHRRA